MKYRTLDQYLREEFGQKLYKIALDGGFTCPNRDGTLGTGGCIFCSGAGSGEFAQDRTLSITEQIERGKERVAAKQKGGKYIAYFQAFTGTYAPVQRLRALYMEAITHRDIAVLSVATRPDCLSEEVIALLREMNGIKPVWVELGLQTIHEKSASYIRRGYPLSVFDDAVRRLKEAGLSVIVHVILGLPGETREEMLQSVDYIGKCGADGIKLQLLHVLRGTDLEKDYLAGRFETLTLEAYAELVADAIALLPKNMVVHRMTGDGDKKALVAPLWSADKKRVLNTLHAAIEKRPEKRSYIAIDLKSFYASVECVERGLDPLTTNLVVADESRTEKTICLAVSPSLKAYGISGRARLFEVVQRVKEINEKRDGEKLTYLVARPRMALYMEYSTKIYHIYLRYVAKEDIHVYSVDEVMIDATSYLSTYKMTARQLAAQMIRDVMKETGITATAGIGTNLYLCKVAMDIVAKHVDADENGLRIAKLDEKSYRTLLWDHRPITDFWRVGRGYAKKLEPYGIYTMGDVARCSIGSDSDFMNEELLYKLFGVNAELLIDHAWGYEPVTMQEIKAYRPETNSISQGQVLSQPYSFEKARIIVQEMTELLVLDLVEKKLVTDQMVLTVGYDVENLTDPKRRSAYKGEVTTDHYGRRVPKHAHGTANLGRKSASTRLIMEQVLALYDRIVSRDLTVRRINVVANRVVSEEEAAGQKKQEFEQLDLFTDYEARDRAREQEEQALKKEKRLQEAMLSVKKKYGKNAILRGTNFQEGATMRQRNEQIGGHKA